jgi:rhodanese-related sulfurtransferase
MTRVLVHAVLIVAVASAIGLVDSIRRPAVLTREAPPPPPVAPDGTPASAATPSPSQPTPAQPTPSQPAPSQPSPPPAQPAALPAGHITIPQAKALADQGARFVDARSRDDFQKGHIPGAMRLLQSAFAQGDPPALAMFLRSETIIVYCNGGKCDESEAVARMLNLSGYKTVYVMHDGFPGWQAAGHPTQTGVGDFPDP